MSVDFKHPDYNENIDKWNLTNNICDAKNLKDYLVKRNPLDLSNDNTVRNNQIFERAVFTAIAGYTSRGFVGQIFDKQPVINLPPQLDYLLENCDGAGNSIYQQSQDSTKDVTRIGRAGLLVDFPANNGAVSKAQLDSGEIFATINKYSASQIINWQTTRIGSKIKKSLVVLETTEDLIGEDGFEFEAVPLIIELRLLVDENNSTVFVVQEWRKSIDGNDEWIGGGYSEPLLDGYGQPWDDIPFVFAGSESNTHQVDQAPMYDIAKINVGHFNNSAIYEDSVYIVDQAQPWASGYTQDYIEQAKASGMYFGSGRLIGVPAGETLGIAQAQPNTLAKEAMNDKIDLIIGLGGMFIVPGSAVKTATQSAGEQKVQHSVLSLISSNVSEAYTQALKYVARYMKVPEENIEFTLNNDFINPDADAQTIQVLKEAFLQRIFPISDFLKWQQRHGLIDSSKTLEEYTEEIDIPEKINLDG